jgi:hypothetical protein
VNAIRGSVVGDDTPLRLSRSLPPQTDECRKRVLLISASILAGRKLAQYDSGARVPATISATTDAIRWAERFGGGRRRRSEEFL